MPARFAVVLLMCLAGCDKLFDLAHIGPRPDASVDAPSDATETGCPPSYDIALPAFPRSRYFYQSIPGPWLSAQALCNGGMGEAFTHLAVIQDEEERMALYGALLAKNVTVTVWIGLSDRKVESDFLWVTDESIGTPPPFMKPWPPNQPDDQGGQDCVRMKAMNESPYGGWFDDGGCSLDFAYVCECDDYASAPANYVP